MKTLDEKVLELVKLGKSAEDILFVCAKEYGEKSSNDEILASLEAAQKAHALTKSVEAKKKAASESAELNAKVDKALEEKLKTIKVEGIVDTLKKSGHVVVKESENLWMKDVSRMLKIRAKGSKASNDENTEINDLSEKSLKISVSKGLMTQKAADAIVSDNDPAGGYFMRPEFDMEVDKLVYKDSELLRAIKIRSGGEKTQINSMGTFDFTTRANQNSDFVETRPEFNQIELNYRETGAVVPLSNYALSGSEYNLVSELAENAADAKIRFYEPLLTTGNVDNPDNDPFDGIRFHDGIFPLTSINNGGTGKLVSKDLSNMFLSSTSQTRRTGVFLMDSKELMLLLEERDNDNNPIKVVEMINGQWIHKATGRAIITVDNMSRTNNALVDNSTGTDVPILFGPMERFRIYNDGGLQMDSNESVFWKSNQMGFRFIFRFKQGIPVLSQSSFVSLQGVKSVAIS